MPDFPLPDNESERLASLKELDLLDTPAEDRYDRITRLACDVLKVENSAINLVDEQRQWGKSTCGVESTEGPREDSFCTYAILDESITVIPDARQDEQFSDNPLVVGEPHIRFYMGHPIHTEDQFRIGTLCVFDSEPREVSPEDKRILKDLAAIVDSELQRSQLNVERTRLRTQLEEAERRSRIDDLTKLWNRRAVFDLIESEVNRSKREGLQLTVGMIDLDDFKEVNDTHGHQVGDQVLRTTAQVLRQSTRDYDVIGRYGGEEFIVMFPESGRDEARRIAERMLEGLRDADFTGGSNEKLSVTMSIGLSTTDSGGEQEPEELIEQADEALYQVKNDGKDTVKSYRG
jgi:diguanylate cyclase (GGDEF)-like protein